MNKITGYFIVLISMLFASNSPATEESELEETFFQAYDQLYEVADRFKNAITQLTPPETFQYTEEDLQAYRQLLSAEDGGNEVLGVFEEARDMALVTGLPYRELAVYQKGNGTYGLNQLLHSVNHLQHIQWVSWYMTLIGAPGFADDTLLFMDDGSTQPQLAALRTEYNEQITNFNQAYEALLTYNITTLRTTQDVSAKNQLAVNAYIYQNIAEKAGKVTWFSKNRSGYPLTNATPKYYSEAATLAEKLSIDFYDLAFIQLKTGTMGLRSLLRKMDWIDADSLIAEVFDPPLPDWQRVMNWAESLFPEFFPAMSRQSLEIPPTFQVRYYSDSNTYLGYNTKDGFFYGYSPTFWGMSVQKFDTLKEYLPSAELAGF